MTERILGPTGSRRRKRFLFIPFMAVLAVALFFIASAQAVHDFKFQLDGDVSAQAYSVPGGTNGPQSYDWGNNSAGDSSSPLTGANGLFNVSDSGALNASGSTETVSNNSALVGAGQTFGAASFQRDFESGSSCTLNAYNSTFCTADDSTYATGSKDTLGIGNGGWQCNHDNNVNSKIDIMNAYTASYLTPVLGDGKQHHII